MANKLRKPAAASDPTDRSDESDRSDQTRRPAWPGGPRSAQAILRSHLDRVEPVAAHEDSPVTEDLGHHFANFPELFEAGPFRVAGSSQALGKPRPLGAQAVLRSVADQVVVQDHTVADAAQPAGEGSRVAQGQERANSRLRGNAPAVE